MPMIETTLIDIFISAYVTDFEVGFGGFVEDRWDNKILVKGRGMDRLYLFFHVDFIISVVIKPAYVTVFLVVTRHYLLVDFIFNHSVQRE